MVKNIALLLVLVTANLFAQNQKPETLKTMSFNVRMDTPKDGVNQWSNRKDWVGEIVRFNEVDIVGMQEVTYGQLVDLQTLLPNYNFVGEGRESGNKGEFSPIFYAKDRFKLLDSGTFWLAEDPTSKGMVSWDSSLPRVATWAKLEDRLTKRNLVFVNTHFDHKGKLAREKSVEVIANQLKLIVKDESVILTGDLNLPPTDLPYQKIIELGFLDSRELATNRAELGFTFNGWNIEAKPTSRIDYIFTKGTDLAPWKYQELDIQRGVRFASDHYPVMTEFRWVSKVDYPQKKKKK
ncbi:MAG: endonuclease/exonuclease/phosphatase family protein [Flavobacterium sp.]